MRVMRILLGTALTAICLSLAGCLGFNFDLGINSGGLNTVPTPPPDDKTPKPYGIAKGINDTGISLCGNYAFDDANVTAGEPADLGGHDNAINCASAGSTQTNDGRANNLNVPAGQDAVYGRDAAAAAGALNGALAKVGAGPAGFDYTKLDASGTDLPANATNWTCVRDNVTQLVWEVKTTANVDEGYSWYSDDNTSNGYSSDGSHTDAQGLRDRDSACTADNEANCKDTQGYAFKLNQEALCGFTDWRLPTVDELLSLVNKNTTSGPMANVGYLGPVSVASHYWSSTSSAVQTSAERGAFAVWVVNFATGADIGTNFIKTNEHPKIRLVRNAP